MVHPDSKWYSTLIGAIDFHTIAAFPPSAVRILKEEMAQAVADSQLDISKNTHIVPSLLQRLCLLQTELPSIRCEKRRYLQYMHNFWNRKRFWVVKVQ